MMMRITIMITLLLQLLFRHFARRTFQIPCIHVVWTHTVLNNSQQCSAVHMCLGTIPIPLQSDKISAIQPFKTLQP